MEQHEENKLLAEYQAAQDSAQHHDNLVWIVTSIIWSGTLVLFGFVLENLDTEKHRLFLTILSSFGIFLIIFVWRLARQFQNIKNQKYKRCKDIEQKLEMKQHTGLKHKKGAQSTIYSIITFFFILIWLFATLAIWNVCLKICF